MSELAAQRDGTPNDGGPAASDRRERIVGNAATPGIILLIMGAIALIAAIAIGTAITILNLRDSTLARSERELENVALLIAKHADHEIEELDVIETSVIEDMKSLGNASSEDFERKMSGADMHQTLKNKISGLSHIGSLVLINSDGMLINDSSAWPISAINNEADRDYFKALKLDAQLTSYVGKPMRGYPGGNWTIGFARKITAPNGEFLGVVLGTIDLQYFEDFFESVRLGDGSSISLFRDDGVLQARYPRIESLIGLSFSAAINALGTRERATFRLTGKMDDKDRLLAAQRLEHFPLFISAGNDVAAALAGWRKQAIILTGLGGLVVLMIVLIVYFIAQQMLQGNEQFNQKLAEQKQQLDVAISHMPQGLIMFNAAAQLVVCNDRYRQLYNLPADLVKPGCTIVELVNCRVANGTFVGNPEEYVSDLLATIAKGEAVKREVETNDGRIISVVNQPMASGGWVGTHDDITERRRAKLELEETKQFLNLIIENIPISVVVKDAKTRKFVLVNQAFEALLAMPRIELLGRTVFDIYKKEDAERIDKSDSESVRGIVGMNSNDYEMEVPMRGTRVLATNRIVVRDAQGDAKYLVVVINDITDRKKSEQRIAFMAHHDALTGLANRSTITQKIEDAAARQRREGIAFNVLLLDLDRFKQVNDTLGHPAGDALLRDVAVRLKAFLRETDVLARLGGDEFAIIQQAETDQRAAAIALANRIFDLIAKPFNIEGNEVNIATSIGIALAPEHATDPDNLLKMADIALYRAKSAGRNGYCFFDPAMSVAADARHELEIELRRAIQQNELELYYQPIVDTKTRIICGAEALVRWRHPTKGMILPDQFIPLAEETGLITQLGERVLSTACSDAASWPAGIKLAVNLSAIQFRKSNLPDVVMYALAQSGLPPERLELEITETALIESAAECLPALQQFKNLGIAIALDDFGTGYSSLSQLTMFPFDKIKIDRSFTQNMTKRAESSAIIMAALTLAKNLDIEITAEGVETIEQYRLLRLAGVTSLQGFLFKAPCPVSEIDFSGVYGNVDIEDAA